MRGTMAAVRIAEDMGWIPPTVAPIHRRLAKSGGGAEFQFYLFPRVLWEAARRGWGPPDGRPMVALMCLSWFAFLRAGEVATIHVADVRGGKALGFWATKRGIIGRRWRRWSEWSGAWGQYVQGYTKGWESDSRVVLGGPPVYEVAVADFLQGTKWADGRWHGHRRGGAAAAWARGPLEAWFLLFGRWEDKRTAMGYMKEFQDPGDLLLPLPEEGDTLGF